MTTAAVLDAMSVDALLELHARLDPSTALAGRVRWVVIDLLDLQRDYEAALSDPVSDALSIHAVLDRTVADAGAHLPLTA